MSSRFLAAVVLCFAIIGSAAVLAQERREVPAFRTYGKPASAEHERAVDELIRSFKDAWSRQDTAKLIALHADDVEWINAYARLIQGAEPLGRFLEERLFLEFDPKVSQQEAMNMKTISSRFMGDDAAVVHLYTDGQRGPSRNANEQTRRTHLHLVLERQKIRLANRAYGNHGCQMTRAQTCCVVGSSCRFVSTRLGGTMRFVPNIFDACVFRRREEGVEFLGKELCLYDAAGG